MQQQKQQQPSPGRLVVPIQPARCRRHLRRVFRPGGHRRRRPRRLLPDLQRRWRVRRLRCGGTEGCRGGERAPVQLGGPLQRRQEEDEDFQERLRCLWVKERLTLILT